MLKSYLDEVTYILSHVSNCSRVNELIKKHNVGTSNRTKLWNYTKNIHVYYGDNNRNICNLYAIIHPETRNAILKALDQTALKNLKDLKERFKQLSMKSKFFFRQVTIIHVDETLYRLPETREEPKQSKAQNVVVPDINDQGKYPALVSGGTELRKYSRSSQKPKIFCVDDNACRIRNVFWRKKGRHCRAKICT